MKIYFYYNTHHRKKHMAARNRERETRYGDTIREMTARGKSAREIANFIQCSENWVARYRTRHNVPMPPGTVGRPRLGDDRPRSDRASHRRERERAARRTAAERAVEERPWSAADVRPVGTRMWLPIPPLHAARPSNPHRRKTFDYEDTGEL
jgi:hypothetical protein